MTKLGKRVSLRFALGTMLATGSCAEPGLNDTERGEVEAIASEKVGDGGSATDLTDKIEALEARLDEIERAASALNEDVDAVRSKAQAATDQAGQMDDRLSRLESRLNQ